MHASCRFLSVFVVAAALACPAPAKEPKLKAEDVVGRHLDALGPAASRAAVKTRIVEGRSRMKFEAGATGAAALGLAAGSLRITSGGSRYNVALPFDYSDYWGEQFVSDGTKVDVAFSYIQQRSPLADFLYRYDMIVEEGLLSGTLSTAWPLLERDERQPKLEYAGLKAMGDRQAHVLNYRRRKGQADLRIELYFDAETFRHVASSYRLTLNYDYASAAQSESQPVAIRGNGTQVPQQSPSVARDDHGRQGAQYRLDEFFSEFRTFDGITLPTHWNVVFERASGNKTVQREWAIIVDKVVHNQAVDANAFRLRERPPGK